MTRSFETAEEERTGLRKVRSIGGCVIHDTPPGTLAEVLESASRGQMFEHALSRFLIEFHTDPDAESRLRRIIDDPGLAPNPTLNVFLGAAGEHLARRWQLGEPPAWTDQPERFSEEPRFMSPGIPEDQQREESPTSFSRRLLYTRSEPLFLSPMTLSLYTFEMVELPEDHRGFGLRF